MSLVQSDNDINFIPLTIKAQALNYYITNYAIKGNCSQYQKVMTAIIVRKAFKNHDTRLGITNVAPELDKCALKTFNLLSYNWEVRRPLIASFLLGFSNHYSETAVVKNINIALLTTRFELMFCG